MTTDILRVVISVMLKAISKFSSESKAARSTSPKFQIPPVGLPNKLKNTTVVSQKAQLPNRQLLIGIICNEGYHMITLQYEDAYHSL